MNSTFHFMRPYCALQNPSPIQQLLVILNNSATSSAVEQVLIIWHDSCVILFGIKHLCRTHLAAKRLGVYCANPICGEKHC